MICIYTYLHCFPSSPVKIKAISDFHFGDKGWLRAMWILFFVCLNNILRVTGVTDYRNGIVQQFYRIVTWRLMASQSSKRPEPSVNSFVICPNKLSLLVAFRIVFYSICFLFHSLIVFVIFDDKVRKEKLFFWLWTRFLCDVYLSVAIKASLSWSNHVNCKSICIKSCSAPCKRDLFV